MTSAKIIFQSIFSFVQLLERVIWEVICNTFAKRLFQDSNPYSQIFLPNTPVYKFNYYTAS